MASDQVKTEGSTSKQRVFPCPICKKGFSQKGNMKRHIPTHAVEKPYRCSECDKAYSTKYELKKHIETHSDTKIIQCPFCSKTFSRSFNLQKHLLTHSGSYVGEQIAEASPDATGLQGTDSISKTKSHDKLKTESKNIKLLNKPIKESTKLADSLHGQMIEGSEPPNSPDEKITTPSKNETYPVQGITAKDNTRYLVDAITDSIKKTMDSSKPSGGNLVQNPLEKESVECIPKAPSKRDNEPLLSNTDCAIQALPTKNSNNSYSDLLLSDQEIHKTPEKEAKGCMLPGEGVDMYIAKELSDFVKKESVKPYSVTAPQDKSKFNCGESFAANPFRDEGSIRQSLLPGKGVDDYLQLELLDIRGENLKGYNSATNKNFRETMAIPTCNIDRIIDEHRVREAWLSYIDRISIISIKEEIKNKIDNVKPDKSHDTDEDADSAIETWNIKKNDVMSASESDKYLNDDLVVDEDLTWDQASRGSHNIPSIPRRLQPASDIPKVSQRVKKKSHKYSKVFSNYRELSHIRNAIAKVPHNIAAQQQDIPEISNDVVEVHHDGSEASKDIPRIPHDIPDESHDIPEVSHDDPEIPHDTQAESQDTKPSQHRPPLQKNYICQHCSKGFVCEKFLKRHIVNHHGHHQCSVCKRSYPSLRHLKRHMLNHTREYQCPVCDRVFSQKGNMKRHALTHGDDKPHQCSECGRKYITKYELKRHLHTHMEETPFYCSVCLKKFTNSKHFERHILLHAKIKPHTCSECGNSFSDNHLLKTHILAHCRTRSTESQM